MKDPKYIDRSMDYFEMKYCDTDDLTVENYQIILHFKLVRFLKTVSMRASDDRTDIEIFLKFIDLLYIYGFILHDELELLRDFKRTFSKEKY